MPIEIDAINSIVRIGLRNPRAGCVANDPQGLRIVPDVGSTVHVRFDGIEGGIECGAQILLRQAQRAVALDLHEAHRDEIATALDEVARRLFTYVANLRGAQ